MIIPAYVVFVLLAWKIKLTVATLETLKFARIYSPVVVSPERETDAFAIRSTVNPLLNPLRIRKSSFDPSHLHRRSLGRLQYSNDALSLSASSAFSGSTHLDPGLRFSTNHDILQIKGGHERPQITSSLTERASDTEGKMLLNTASGYPISNAVVVNVTCGHSCLNVIFKGYFVNHYISRYGNNFSNNDEVVRKKRKRRKKKKKKKKRRGRIKRSTGITSIRERKSMDSIIKNKNSGIVDRSSELSNRRSLRTLLKKITRKKRLPGVLSMTQNKPTVDGYHSLEIDGILEQQEFPLTDMNQDDAKEHRSMNTCFTAMFPTGKFKLLRNKSETENLPVDDTIYSDVLENEREYPDISNKVRGIRKKNRTQLVKGSKENILIQENRHHLRRKRKSAVNNDFQARGKSPFSIGLEREMRKGPGKKPLIKIGNGENAPTRDSSIPKDHVSSSSISLTGSRIQSSDSSVPAQDHNDHNLLHDQNSIPSAIDYQTARSSSLPSESDASVEFVFGYFPNKSHFRSRRHNNRFLLTNSDSLKSHRRRSNDASARHIISRIERSRSKEQPDAADDDRDVTSPIRERDIDIQDETHWTDNVTEYQTTDAFDGIIKDRSSTKKDDSHDDNESTDSKVTNATRDQRTSERLSAPMELSTETSSARNVTLENQRVTLQNDEDEQLIEDLLERLVLNMTSQKRPGGRRSSLPILDTAGSVRIPCYVVIFLLGFVGNSLVIVTLLQHRKMRTITNVFLLNLAFSDLLLGVFCMPFTLVGSLLRDFIFGAVMCRLIPYFQAVSVSVSVWTLVAISLERYYAICQPLRSRGWQTLSHAYKIISLVWILSLVFMVPIAALSQLHPIGNSSRNKCREMWPSLHLERGFCLMLGAVLLLVPLLIMTVAYSSITISLWHGMKLERETGQGTKSLISLTDLHSLAMVQQSLQQKQQSKKHASKISIRFRKIPSQSPSSKPCDQLDDFSRSCAVSPNPSCSKGSAPDTNGENSGHACARRSGRQSFKWHLEAASDSATPCVSLDRKSTSTGFKRLRSTHLEKSIEAKKHVIRMLFVVVLEFFLCWTPIFVVNIMCLYIPEKVYRALGAFGISFLHLLSYASSCCNPVTYCFMNKKFLQGFRHAFGCRKETDRIARQNGTAASFRSQSNNLLRFAVDCRKDVRETTV